MQVRKRGLITEIKRLLLNIIPTRIEYMESIYSDRKKKKEGPSDIFYFEDKQHWLLDFNPLYILCWIYESRKQVFYLIPKFKQTQTI